MQTKTCKDCGKTKGITEYRKSPNGKDDGIFIPKEKGANEAIMNRKKRYAHLIGNRHAAGSGPKKTSFKRGAVPWNKGLRGTHCSPETEWKPGHRPDDFCAMLKTIRIRQARRDGKARKYIKVKHPSTWEEYARYQWKQFFGHILPGDVVHHINGNVMDDQIGNLIAIPKAIQPKVNGRWGLRFLSEAELATYKLRYAEVNWGGNEKI